MVVTSSESETAWDGSPVVGAVEPFETFYRRTYRPMVGLAVVLSARRDMAEDIAQDALMAAFRSWERVSRLDDPAAWVRRVVANKSVSLFRRSMSELRALIRLGKPGVTGTDPDFVEALDFWASVHRLLPRRQAVAVALRYVEALKLEEIADVMGCSTSTASTHLRRAHERLAGELDVEWKEDW
jgi:RNA polymerase sigma factor (sigma-70 family)